MPASLSVRLPDETAKALEELARTTERSKTSLILKALEAYLADYAEYQIALDRLRDKDDPVISAAKLRKRLGRQEGYLVIRIGHRREVYRMGRPEP